MKIIELVCTFVLYIVLQFFVGSIIPEITFSNVKKWTQYYDAK